MKVILGPIIGEVTHNKAKVWIFWNRSHDNETVPHCHVFKDKTCTKEISRSKFKTVSSSIHEYEIVHGVSGLADISFPVGGEKFYFKIKSGSTNDEENDRIYSIRPFPEIGAKIDTLSFALISCHRPLFYPRIDKKTVAPMWRRLGHEMRRHDCRFLIQAGDQVYSDHKRFNAWKWSLKEDSQEKRLWYYRQIYLKSWNFPEVQEVMRTFPQYMIWDDHEIGNSWGSEEKHSKEARHKQVFEIARQAYIEFQHCHNPDPLREGELYYAFNYGPAAFLVMDLRGHRDIALYDPTGANDTYPLAGREQWEDIKAWLNSEVIQESSILFVVTSVPVCHLSRKFGSLGIFKSDINDQWSTMHNKRERRILLDLLYEWSGERKRPVFILSGDVHLGTVATITEEETAKPIYQITSSPITNNSAYYLDFFIAKFSSQFNFHLERNNKRPVCGEITRRYRRRNFAIVNVQFIEQNPKVDLHMYEQGKGEPDSISLC